MRQENFKVAKNLKFATLHPFCMQILIKRSTYNEMMCACHHPNTSIEHSSELNVLKRWFMPYVLIKHVTAVEFKACAMCFFDILLLSCVLFLISARGTEFDHYKYVLTLLLYNISPSSSLSPSSLVAPLATYKKYIYIPSSSYQTYSSATDSHGIWNANLFTCEIESYDVWSLVLVYHGV